MEQFHYAQLNETLYDEKLPNGLPVYVLPKPGYKKTYATLTTRFGSIDAHFRLTDGRELKVPDGVAHFLEHKMFEEEDGDVFNRFAAQGASANAFTSFTRTAYLFSSTSKVKENLNTLLDFVQHPYFTEQNVEKEKGIIGQEIRMYDDDPDWQVFFGLIGALYHKHPLRIDIAGTVESIAQIDKELLYTCYETFYHPNNMLLFVVGNVEPGEVIRWVKDNQAKKNFVTPLLKEKIYPEEPPGVAQKEKRILLSVGIPKLLFGYKEDKMLSGRALLKRELVTEVVLEAVFGPASPLYQKLYEQNLIDENFGYDYNEESTFAFSAIGGDTSDPDRVMEIVLAELEHLQAHGLERKTFQRVHRKKLGQFIRSLNSLEFIANQFTAYQFHGTNFFDILPTLEEIQFEEANWRLREHLQPSNLAICKVEPPREKKAT